MFNIFIWLHSIFYRWDMFFVHCTLVLQGLAISCSVALDPLSVYPALKKMVHLNSNEERLDAILPEFQFERATYIGDTMLHRLTFEEGHGHHLQDKECYIPPIQVRVEGRCIYLHIK